MNTTAKRSLAGLLLLLAVCLGGCGMSGKTGAVDEAAALFRTEVSGRLEEAEQRAAALQKRLDEDASLTQAGMNALAGEIAGVWDGLMKDVLNILKDSLAPEAVVRLLQEQEAWEAERQVEAAQAGTQYAGGSMASLASGLKWAELTKIRVYALSRYPW